MRRLYYTVEYEIENETLTGNKTVIVYDLAENTPINLATIELTYEDNSKEAIKEYLETVHGWENTKELELILL